MSCWTCCVSSLFLPHGSHLGHVPQLVAIKISVTSTCIDCRYAVEKIPIVRRRTSNLGAIYIYIYVCYRHSFLIDGTDGWNHLCFFSVGVFEAQHIPISSQHPSRVSDCWMAEEPSKRYSTPWRCMNPPPPVDDRRSAPGGKPRDDGWFMETHWGIKLKLQSWNRQKYTSLDFNPC